MRVLLDTAVFIFSVERPERLSRRAERILKNQENIRELSVVSLTEIAVKTSLGKLSITAALARQAIEDLRIHVLPFTGEHAFGMFALPPLHRDPFDRQIISQALLEDIPVVTPDEQFGRYRDLKVIW